jgi:NADPH:quinone reductase-like Zn-dependent oxidoreductase
MRAWQVVRNGEPDIALELGESALPPLGPGDLNIRVIASGLALPDVLQCRGTYPLKPTMPFTPGLEFIGEVVAAGADVATDYSAKDFVAEVQAATDGRGADVIYDPVGGEVFERSVQCTAREGRLIPIGYASGRWGMIPPTELNWRNASIVGALPSGIPRSEMLAMHAHLAGLYETGKIRVAVDHQIAFADIAEGLMDVAQRRVQGRIVALH